MRCDITRSGKWHNWFAWHVVYCEETDFSMWLEVVERRVYTNPDDGTVHKVYRVKTK